MPGASSSRLPRWMKVKSWRINPLKKRFVVVQRHKANGGNLATWRLGVSVSFSKLKPRCQVSVLVRFYDC